MKILVSFSGGMDSATLLVLAVKKYGPENVEAISFNYGSKHNHTEFEFAKKFANHYGIQIHRFDLEEIFKSFQSDLLKTGGDIPEGHYADPSMKKTVVPFRNGIMLSIAVGFAESNDFKTVAIANHFGDHAIYPDCRTSFIESFKRACKTGTYEKIEIYAPFASKTKTEIAKIGKSLGVPYELTYSCYNGREKHCGKCGTCFERKEAFMDAGIQDPTEYE